MTVPAADAPVLDDGAHRVGRDELDGVVAGVAAALQARGVGAGSRVAWILRNQTGVLLLALGAKKVGAVVVALGYRSTPDEIGRMLGVAAPVIVVVDDVTAELVADGPQRVHIRSIIGPLPDAGGRPARPVDPHPAAAAVEPRPDRLGAGASLLFTSGTTGTPKAAVRTRGDARLAEAIADGMELGPTTSFLAAGPLYHSGPWTCALMTVARGGRVTIRPRFDPHDWLDAALACGATSGFLTPTQLRRIVEVAERDASSRPALTNVVVSGEPFPTELKRRAIEVLGAGFVEVYGCTELGPMTAIHAREFEERPGSCGRPFPGVEIGVFVEGRPAGPHEVGLVQVRTPMAFDGYIEGAALQPVAAHGWSTVGDVGSLDEDGYLYLSGRSDDLIITGGVNVHPVDVEAALLQHPGLRDVAVFGTPDEEWGEVVTAAVVADRPLELDEVREWLRGRISDDKRPRRLVQVEALPVTANGKASRRLARAQALGPIDAATAR